MTAIGRTTEAAASSSGFPSTYGEARRRFRVSAERAGWSLEAWDTGETGPDGQILTIDAAAAGSPESPRLLIVSSGLHGVEGPFGSAVQAAAIAASGATLPGHESSGPGLRLLFLHALNPYGFAWSRRADGQNVDPNRNLLAPGEQYVGDATAYGRFDRLLNPRRPPSRIDAFPIQMLLALARHGRPALKQALAAGQYDFPKGLFFGGNCPTVTNRLLTAELPQRLEHTELVVHLDLHTGLGRFGEYRLLVDDRMSLEDTTLCQRLFGRERVETGDPDQTSYRARGHLGRWAEGHRSPTRRYVYVCAEFGTYGNLAMLAALRAENQAHHWARRDDPRAVRARDRLRRLFCPPSEGWRRRVLAGGLDLVRTAAARLATEPSER